jgi:preprotein translocase subunit SecE
MAQKQTNESVEESEPAPEGAGGDLVAGSDDSVEVAQTPAQLGSAKYVHAAFFAAGILGAFIIGKVLAAVWNRLAEWPAAVRAVPALLRYAEDERPGFTMVAGAIISLLVVVQTYRKEATRHWADEVASELSKVVWPNRETVTNGTIVVIVASILATIYVGLLDRFWGFVTTLVYGA